MANCKATRVETVYDLSLNEAEAMVLLELTAHVGGQPEGPRGKIDAIGAALKKAGVPRKSLRTDPGLSAVYFADGQ